MLLWVGRLHTRERVCGCALLLMCQLEGEKQPPMAIGDGCEEFSDQEDKLTIAVLLSKQAEDMPDEGDPTTRSMRARSTGRPCRPQPSFVPNHDALEIFPSAALASPVVPLPTWHCPSPIAASSPSAAAIAVPSSFPCPSSLAPKLWISPLKPRFSRVVMMDTLHKEAGAEVQENEPYVPKALHRPVTHSMPPKKIEIFKSLEEWTETKGLTYLKPVEKSWQPQDFLPDPSFDGFVDDVSEFRACCAELPNDYLVCLVGHIITEEALPTYQTILNTLDGVQDEPGEILTSWAKMSFEEHYLTGNIGGLVLLSVLNFCVMSIIVLIFLSVCVQGPNSCKEGHQPPFQIFICSLSLATSRIGDASNEAVSAVLRVDASTNADQDAQGRPPIKLAAVRGRCGYTASLLPCLLSTAAAIWLGAIPRWTPKYNALFYNHPG